MQSQANERISFATAQRRGDVQRAAPSLRQIRARLELEYAPYHRFCEFQVGYQDYLDGRARNPYGVDNVAAQGWDRGAECAMRVLREYYRD